MTSIICAKDGREFRVKKNYEIAEQLDGNGDPYKLWSTDRWACPDCGVELLVTAPNPLAEHYQPGYLEGPYRERVTVTWRQ